MKYVFPVLFLFIVGCASTNEPPVTKAHPAASSVSDTFLYEQGMPVREVKAQNFFFSDCSQKFWRPFSTKTEYTCNTKPW